MTDRERRVLGAATSLLVVSYVVAALRFAPGVSITTDSRVIILRSPPQVIPQAGLAAAGSLTFALAIVYGRLVAGGTSSRGRQVWWWLCLVVAAPVSMPTYFLRHLPKHRA